MVLVRFWSAVGNEARRGGVSAYGFTLPMYTIAPGLGAGVAAVQALYLVFECVHCARGGILLSFQMIHWLTSEGAVGPLRNMWLLHDCRVRYV